MPGPQPCWLQPLLRQGCGTLASKHPMTSVQFDRCPTSLDCRDGLWLLAGTTVLVSMVYRYYLAKHPMTSVQFDRCPTMISILRQTSPRPGNPATTAHSAPDPVTPPPPRTQPQSRWPPSYIAWQTNVRTSSGQVSSIRCPIERNNRFKPNIGSIICLS